MDRRDYFFLQKVQEDELDAGFTGAEEALFNISLDVGFFGVMFGLAVLEQTPTPDLTVRVIGPGSALDNAGQRCGIAGTQTVDLSVDSSSVSTSVVTPGNEKIVSLFIEFARANSDPRIDGNSASVFFVQDESFAFFVTQGAEGAPPATPPSLQAGKVLLGDITLTQGQTQIFDASIAAGDTALGGAITDRRQDHIVIDTNFVDVRTGSFAVALLALATEIDTFVAGAAAGIAYAGGPNWADATTNPATDVEAQLDKIITDLSTAGGAAKTFSDALSGSPDSVSAGTLASVLNSLLGHVNDRLELAGGTMTGAIVPNATGVDLGSGGARFDAFLETVDATLFNSLTVAEAPTTPASQAEIERPNKVNVARAWGSSNQSGTILFDYNIASITRNGNGDYTIVLDQNWAAAFGDQAHGAVIALNAFPPDTAGTCEIAPTATSGTFQVFTYNTSGTKTDHGFNFAIHGRDDT